MINLNKKINSIYYSFIFLSLISTLYILYKYLNFISSPLRFDYLIYLVCFVLLDLSLIFCLFLSKKIKINFLIINISILFSFYLLQIPIFYFDFYDRNQIMKKKLIYEFNKSSLKKFDTRNRYEYYLDEKKKN